MPLKSHTLVELPAFEHICYELRPAVAPHGAVADGLCNAWIILNNPRQYNSYTTDALKELILAFREASTVFVVPATGGDIRRIGTGESWAWSPDAKMLALEGPGGVQLIDIDTGDRVAQVDDVTGMDSWQRVARS